LYGGVEESCNKLLIKDKDTHPEVLLDFGMSFGMRKLLCAPPFLSQTSGKSLQETGILLAEFAYADVDRLNGSYEVAKKSGRCLVHHPSKPICPMRFVLIGI
jgi:hypothetical protein